MSGGISYDNKLNVSTKVAGQVRRARPAGAPVSRARARPAQPKPRETPQTSALLSRFPRHRRARTPPVSLLRHPRSTSQNVKADLVSKGTEVTASATANYAVDKDISADVTVNEKGDVKATLSHAGHRWTA